MHICWGDAGGVPPKALLKPRILDRGVSDHVLGCTPAPFEAYRDMRVRRSLLPPKQRVILRLSQGQKPFPIGDSVTPRRFSHAMDPVLTGTGQARVDLDPQAESQRPFSIGDSVTHRRFSHAMGPVLAGTGQTS